MCGGGGGVWQKFGAMFERHDERGTKADPCSLNQLDLLSRYKMNTVAILDVINILGRCDAILWTVHKPLDSATKMNINMRL